MTQKPKTRSLLLKALFSDDAMEKLYEARRDHDGSKGVRNRNAVIVSFGLLAVSLVVLLAASWVPTNQTSYIDSQSEIFSIPLDGITWEASPLVIHDCSLLSSCFAELESKTSLSTATIDQIDKISNTSDKTKHLRVNLAVPTESVDTLRNQQAFTISLPRFRFKRAEVHLSDGTFVGTYFSSERMTSSLESRYLEGDTLFFEVLFTIPPSDRTISGSRTKEGAIVATLGGWSRYRSFLGAKESNAVGRMGQLAKVVLALFCLLLFLIVDSSSESYALALFMGFEAAAMGVGSGWFPLGLIGVDDHKSAIANYCYQMGDILKIYFFFQISRIGPRSAAPWLIIGTMASIPYGFFMEWAGQTGLTWQYKIPRTRDTIAGTLGVILCSRALWMLRDKTLPWRKAALILAGCAGLFEIGATWLAHSDLSRIYPEIRTAFTIFQANAGYLFALSTFLNISTLENRVSTLGKIKARADEIERELQIGQIVQQSLLKPPQLPEDVSIHCHHEAALYVSGDTYYAHWDEALKRVSFLVSDVTGHGVQAALKASACTVIARTLWEDRPTPTIPELGERLQEFDRSTEKLLVEINRTPDFNSLIGAEFDYQTGDLVVYRSNFTFPLLIEPKVSDTDEETPILGEFWNTQVLPTRNKSLVKKKISRGSFLVFLSDGFMESSRDAKIFSTYIRRALANRNSGVTVPILRDLILDHEPFKKNKIYDDKTLVVFQWELDSAKHKKVREHG